MNTEPKLDYTRPVIAVLIIALLVMIYLLSGCSPARKLKRAEKLIAKAEEQGAKWHVDTVTVEVPVFVPSVRVDSTIVIKAGDTVTIEKERLKVRYIRLKGDTIKIEAECAADTIYKKIPVTIVKTIKSKGGIKWWWIPIALLVGAILGRFVLKLLL
jgi:hypothetical protein